MTKDKSKQPLPFPRLEDKSSTLGLLVTTQLEVLASLQRQLQLGLARVALETEHDLLGGLGLLVEDRLRLTTVTGLLSVVTSDVSEFVPSIAAREVDVGSFMERSRGSGSLGTYRS